MNYSEAMKAAQEGAAVSCWTPYWFVYYVSPASYPAQSGVAKAYFGEEGLVPYAGYFAQYIVDDGIVSMYHPSPEELFMEWHLVKIGEGVPEWMKETGDKVAPTPQSQSIAATNLEVLMEAGKLIFGYWWKPADPVEDTEIPIMRDGEDMRNRFIETAEKIGRFNLSANAARNCRTVGEILELIH